MKTIRIDGKYSGYYLTIAVFLILFALIFRGIGIYPVVFADEYTYSKFSRLLPFSESIIPGYLFLAIYRVTNVLGDGFLNGARILNALFFVTAAPFIYLTARRVCTAGAAFIVTLLALLGPINNYTVYFMPESFYFFSFWVFTWFVLGLDNASDARSWCLAGILLGVSSLIKPHALFLLPALVIYIFYAGWKKEGGWVWQVLANTVIFTFCVFTTKFLIGYLMAGKAGITLFGPVYSSIATSASAQYQRYMELLALSRENAKEHMLGMCLMFGMPVAAAVFNTCRSFISKEEIKSEQKLSLYALSILLSLIMVTCLYSASIIGSGPYESISRLHMRYYNFTFPLLVVLAASQFQWNSTTRELKWRLITALPIGLAIAYAVNCRMVPYTSSMIDNPELHGFMLKMTSFLILGGLSFIALAFWVYAPRTGAKIFVYGLMTFSIIVSNIYINYELRQRMIPDIYDKAGLLIKEYLPDEELSKVLIIGSDAGGLFRTLFYLDNALASLEVTPKVGDYDWKKIPADKEWILVIGDHALPEKTFFKLPFGGFTLVRLNAAAITVNFKASIWPGVMAQTDGLSVAEPWGTWSTGKMVTFKFANSLPEKFTIYLKANAFGPNAGKDFVAHVGTQAIVFKLSQIPEEKILQFSNPNGLRILTIDVPSPVSPKEMGLNSDGRALGIGFFKLRIVPLPG